MLLVTSVDTGIKIIIGIYPFRVSSKTTKISSENYLLKLTIETQEQ